MYLNYIAILLLLLILFQFLSTIKNLKEGLDYYGLDYSNVVKSLVMLKNMDDFPKFNEIYVSYFEEPLPVRSSFGVTDLAMGGCVEIEFLAHK